VKLDGRTLTVFDGAGKPVTPEQYTALIRSTIGG
jgi:hypothetical protein